MTQAQDSTLGDLLRARRLELDITLEEAAARTRIRRIYLEALEESRPESLPGRAYQTGFLRSYARLLELESASVLGEIGEHRPVEPLSPQAMPTPRRPRKAVLAALTLVTALLVSALFFFAFPQRTPGAGKPLPVEPPQGLAGASGAPHLATAAIAPGGSSLRLAALGDCWIALSIDNHRPQRYALSTDTFLVWRVEQAAMMRFGDPRLVTVWLDEDPIDLAGRSELFLSPSASNSHESER